MFNPTFIVSPVVGAIIGWFTNDLAIKMIFRPLYPKYIGKWKLPFTPGLIPKEKNRIAKAIGETTNTLLSTDAMQRTLLSDDIVARIESVMDGFIVRQMSNAETLNEFLNGLVSQTTMDEFMNKGKATIGTVIKEKLSDSTFSQQIADNIVKNVSEKMKSRPLLGPIARLGVGDMIFDGLKSVLGNTIHNVLENNTETIVSQVVDGGIDQLMGMEMSKIFSDNQEGIQNIKSQIVNAYKKGVVDFLPKILDNINMPKIVENKINEMDIAEVEEMLMDIIRKELRTIVLLGAVLGFVMGFITAFINVWLG